MSYINRMKIEGFKKFNKFEINFNKYKNILVGSNEAGKSSIIEAIDIVLNQKYKNIDKYIIKDLLNVENISRFKENPNIENLPYIKIGIDLEFEENAINALSFFGENQIGLKEEAKLGILFECVFDEEEYGELLKSEIDKGNIPYEYYKFSWNTYSGNTYIYQKKPIKSITIDNSKLNTNSSFNYYNKNLFHNKYSPSSVMDAKNSFSIKIDDVFKDISLEDIDEHRKFGINHKKVVLDSIISVYDNNILLENKGSGVENLVKTEIALNKNKSNIDLVLIEEPENHLSHENLLKMISNIENSINEGQLIITTHNDLITSRLGLRNVIWIDGEEAKMLDMIDINTSNFFMKMDSNNLLQFLLSKKVILVEGATEFLLMPRIFKKVTGSNIDDSNLSIISCRNIAFKRYLDLIDSLDKKIAVITDNDKKNSRIEWAENYNNKYENKRIFMDDNIGNWTWEVSLYNSNQEFFNEKVDVFDKCNYCFHGVDYGKVIGKMLNNKVETAFNIIDELDLIYIPKYVEDAIKWIVK